MRWGIKRYAAECQRPVIEGMERQNLLGIESGEYQQSEGASLAITATILCKASSAAWLFSYPDDTDTYASTECRHHCRVSARTLPAWLYKSGFYKSGDLFVDELDQPGAIHTEVVEYDFAGRINQD